MQLAVQSELSLQLAASCAVSGAKKAQPAVQPPLQPVLQPLLRKGARATLLRSVSARRPWMRSSVSSPPYPRALERMSSDIELLRWLLSRARQVLYLVAACSAESCALRGCMHNESCTCSLDLRGWMSSRLRSWLQSRLAITTAALYVEPTARLVFLR